MAKAQKRRAQGRYTFGTARPAPSNCSVGCSRTWNETDYGGSRTDEGSPSEWTPRVLDVLQRMTLQVLLCGEALATGGAPKGPFAGVGQHVALDVGRVVGRVTAQAARVPLLEGARDWPRSGGRVRLLAAPLGHRALGGRSAGCEHGR